LFRAGKTAGKKLHEKGPNQAARFGGPKRPDMKLSGMKPRAREKTFW